MNVPYDVARDFAPISRILFMPLVLVKSSQVQTNSVQELVNVIRAAPGKYNFSSSGTGGGPHIAGEIFKSVAGLDMTHVPYNGAAPALTDVAAGVVPLSFTTYASAQALLKTDKLSAVAITGKRRLDSLPQVPTFEESGLRGLDIGVMNGLLAPANTPQPVIDKIYAAVQRAAQRKELKAHVLDQGAVLLAEDPAQFGAYIRADLQRWKELTVRTAGGK